MRYQRESSLRTLGVHLQREMGVHRMISQHVPALSGCWLGDILVMQSLGDLFIVF